MSEAVIRAGMRPGDLGMVVHLHGHIYAQEYGLDVTFEPYVAEPLSAFARAGERAGRIFFAERDGTMLGCVAMVRDTTGIGQLRWFILVPDARGMGLGKRLLQSALDFARTERMRAVYLWTFDELDAAIALYRRHGFVETDRKSHALLWGRAITEMRMDLVLDEP